VLTDWVLDRLQNATSQAIVLVRDPLHLISASAGEIHRYAEENGFTVVIAATNLVYRELIENAMSARDVDRLLIIDRAPMGRRKAEGNIKAPPPFYPDLLSRLPEEAIIEIDLRQFLIESSGDPFWPHETNEPQIARIVAGCLNDILKAHGNLRTAHKDRFTDGDLRVIVAFAALGIPEAAFKHLDSGSCWQIGLLKHDVLRNLDSIAPSVAVSIKKRLREAPKPFAWFADHPADLVLKAFYYSLILSQHTDHWELVSVSMDPALKPFSGMDPEDMSSAAKKLTVMAPARVHADLSDAESSLSIEAIDDLFNKHLSILEPQGYYRILKSEKYSVLIRCLTLILALNDLIRRKAVAEESDAIRDYIGLNRQSLDECFADKRPSNTWSQLTIAYELVYRINTIYDALQSAVKESVARGGDNLSFNWFWSRWSDARISRLDYYASKLERLVNNADFLPRDSKELPARFSAARDNIIIEAQNLSESVSVGLQELNAEFQKLVACDYKNWIEPDSEIKVTSRFLSECVKPLWDPHKEQAVIFVFDGMRLDIWEEIVRPVFEDRMDIESVFYASSLLPSETHISRKAISAGAFPNSFKMDAAEDKLLKTGIDAAIGLKVEVQAVVPDGTGIGQTVQYSSERLQCYIFELCDKELHKIGMKNLPDGRQVPGRPISFIYDEHIKSIIDNEVSSIIRQIPSGAKVFVVADHGFGRVGRDRIHIDANWLNESSDCSYQHATLRKSLADIRPSKKILDNVIEFEPSELRLPSEEIAKDRKSRREWKKTYKSIIFPKSGFALSRPDAHFNPDAFSHGGISLDEMLIPMVAMKVRSEKRSLVRLGQIQGPLKVVENEVVRYSLQVELAPGADLDELRVEGTASLASGESEQRIPPQVHFVTRDGLDMAFSFEPDVSDATDEERAAGSMQRALQISVLYHSGDRPIRRSRQVTIVVRLNPERITRRVPAHLGKILGLNPKK